MSRHIIRFPLAALIGAILMTMACCTHRSAAWPMLSAADSLMESRPDSALAILHSVDPSALPSGEESARYALLMSMALDKNYVDTTTFDILQPAIDYYLRKGTPDERLRTLYYQGRIYDNRHDYDRALQAFTRAIESTPVYSDSLTMAHVLYASGNVSKENYDFQTALRSYLDAAKVYHYVNRPPLEFDCLLNALNCTLVIGDKNIADSLANICLNFQPVDNESRSRLRSNMLTYHVCMRAESELRDFIASEKDNLKSDMNDLLMLARAYNTLGESQKARELLEYVTDSGEEYDRTKYLSIAVLIYRDLGDYKKAFKNYWDFNHITESLMISQYEQKTALITEKYMTELKAQNYKHKNNELFWESLSGFIFLIFVIITLGLIARKNKIGRELANKLAHETELKNKELESQKKEKESEAKHLAERVEDLEKEITTFINILETSDNIPHDMQDIIRSRLELLNNMLARFITADNESIDKLLEKNLKELTVDVEQFMKTNRLSFQASHPRFIRYLVDHHLTEHEINYVCLYAIGLNGKQVGKFIGRSGHINTSSTIRSKLEIDRHETYLSIYIRRLLEKS